MAPQRKRYDAIIIGGGHNGLVTAAYLAKAGKSVCVLERRHVLGGCATTEELWPGFKVSTAAYVISLFLPEITQDLRLKSYGLHILPRNPSSFTPLPDGRSLTLGPDPELCRREISKFSVSDAAAYPQYNRLLEQVAAVLEPMLSQAAPDPLPLPREWRHVGWGKRLRDTNRLWHIHQSLKGLGDRMPEAIELLTGAARPILERWFEAEVLRATLATDAIIGAFDSISAPGTAYVLLHHVMGEAGGARGVWGYVQGGMGGLATALEQACLDQRVDIFRESPVAQDRDGRQPSHGRRLGGRYARRRTRRRLERRRACDVREDDDGGSTARLLSPGGVAHQLCLGFGKAQFGPRGTAQLHGIALHRRGSRIIMARCISLPPSTTWNEPMMMPNTASRGATRAGDDDADESRSDDCSGGPASALGLRAIRPLPSLRG